MRHLHSAMLYVFANSGFFVVIGLRKRLNCPIAISNDAPFQDGFALFANLSYWHILRA